MAERDLRRKLFWLIAIRVGISSLLLGSAVFVQLTSPGTFSGEPLFLLIGVTYALNILWTLTLKWTERLQLARRFPARVRSADRLGVHRRHRRHHQLFRRALRAAHRGRQQRAVPARRDDDCDAQRAALLGIVLTQYFGLAGLLGFPFFGREGALPPPRIVVYTTGLNVFLFFSIAFLSGSLADRLQRAGARLERASSEIADLQAFNQHVIDSLASGLATTDPQGRILTFNRAAEAITGHPAFSVVGRRLEEVLELPPNVADDWRISPTGRGAAASRRRTGRATAGDRPRIYGDATSRTWWQRRVVVRISGCHRHQEARARRAAAAASGGRRRDGGRHRARDPQSARVDVGIDSDSPAGAAAHGRAGAADGHRAARIRAAERHDSVVPGLCQTAAFSIARLDVRRVLNDAALLLRNSSEVLDGHVIEVDVPATEVAFEADENQIRQIVWNLATNGLRGCANGGRLMLGARVDPGGESLDSVVLDVADEGVGIPAEELDAIFQPFRGTFSKGTGLGLAIVHRIVSDYGGEIQVSSTPGRERRSVSGCRSRRLQRRGEGGTKRRNEQGSGKPQVH